MIIAEDFKDFDKIPSPLLFAIFKNILSPKLNPYILIKDELFSLKANSIDGSIISSPRHTFGLIRVIPDSGEAYEGFMA